MQPTGTVSCFRPGIIFSSSKLILNCDRLPRYKKAVKNDNITFLLFFISGQGNILMHKAFVSDDMNTGAVAKFDC